MTTHANMIEGEQGDLIDIEYACSELCAWDQGFPQPSAWPGGMETDYDVFCGSCGFHMWHGIQCYENVDECNADDDAARELLVAITTPPTKSQSEQ
jgi:hypothetical protein